MIKTNKLSVKLAYADGTPVAHYSLIVTLVDMESKQPTVGHFDKATIFGTISQMAQFSDEGEAEMQLVSTLPKGDAYIYHVVIKGEEGAVVLEEYIDMPDKDVGLHEFDLEDYGVRRLSARQSS